MLCCVSGRVDVLVVVAFESLSLPTESTHSKSKQAAIKFGFIICAKQHWQSRRRRVGPCRTALLWVLRAIEISRAPCRVFRASLCRACCAVRVVSILCCLFVCVLFVLLVRPNVCWAMFLWFWRDVRDVKIRYYTAVSAFSVLQIDIWLVVNLSRQLTRCACVRFPLRFDVVGVWMGVCFSG